MQKQRIIYWPPFWNKVYGLLLAEQKVSPSSDKNGEIQDICKYLFLNKI